MDGGTKASMVYEELPDLFLEEEGRFWLGKTRLHELQ